MVNQPNLFFYPPNYGTDPDRVFYDNFTSYKPDKDAAYSRYGDWEHWDADAKWKVLSGQWDLIEPYAEGSDVKYTRQLYVYGPQPQQLIGGGYVDLVKWWPVEKYFYYGTLFDWSDFANGIAYLIVDVEPGCYLNVGERISFRYGDRGKLYSTSSYTEAIEGYVAAKDGNRFTIEVDTYLGTNHLPDIRRSPLVDTYPSGTLKEVYEDNSALVVLDDNHDIKYSYWNIRNIILYIQWDRYRNLYNYYMGWDLRPSVAQSDGTVKDELYVYPSSTSSIRKPWPAIGTKLQLQQYYTPPPNIEIAFFKTFTDRCTIISYNSPYVVFEVVGHRFEVGDLCYWYYGCGEVTEVEANQITVYLLEGTADSRSDTITPETYTETGAEAPSDDYNKYYPGFNISYPGYRNSSQQCPNMSLNVASFNDFPEEPGEYYGQIVKRKVKPHKMLYGYGKIRIRQQILHENLKITVHVPTDKQSNPIYVYFAGDENLADSYCLEYIPSYAVFNDTVRGNSIEGWLSVVSTVDIYGHTNIAYNLKVNHPLNVHYDSLADIHWSDGTVRRDVWIQRQLSNPCSALPNITLFVTATDIYGYGYNPADEVGWGDPWPTTDGLTCTIIFKSVGKFALYAPNGNKYDVEVYGTNDDILIQLWRDGDNNLIVCVDNTPGIKPNVMEVNLGEVGSLSEKYIGIGTQDNSPIYIDLVEVEKVQPSLLSKQWYDGNGSLTTNPIFFPGTMPNCIKLEITGNNLDYPYSPGIFDYKYACRLGTYYVPLNDWAYWDNLNAGSFTWQEYVPSQCNYHDDGQISIRFYGYSTWEGGKEYKWHIDYNGPIVNDVYYPVLEFSSSSKSSLSQSSISTSSISSSQSISSKSSKSSLSSSKSSFSSSSISTSSSLTQSSKSSVSSISSSSISSSSSYSSRSSTSSVSSSSSSWLSGHLIDGRNFIAQIPVSYSFPYYTKTYPYSQQVTINETWTITSAHNHAPDNFISGACDNPLCVDGALCGDKPDSWTLTVSGGGGTYILEPYYMDDEYIGGSIPLDWVFRNAGNYVWYNYMVYKWNSGTSKWDALCNPYAAPYCSPIVIPYEAYGYGGTTYTLNPTP